jgi:hypothetical protein
MKKSVNAYCIVDETERPINGGGEEDMVQA